MCRKNAKYKRGKGCTMGTHCLLQSRGATHHKAQQHARGLKRNALLTFSGHEDDSLGLSNKLFWKENIHMTFQKPEAQHCTGLCSQNQSSCITQIVEGSGRTGPEQVLSDTQTPAHTLSSIALSSRHQRAESTTQWQQSSPHFYGPCPTPKK